MARRRKSNRRRRRGSFGFLYKLLSTLAICAVVVAALTLFFRVDTIEVTGNSRYTAQEIADREVVSIYTIRAHTRSIYAKLDVHSKKELTALVQKQVDQAE